MRKLNTVAGALLAAPALLVAMATSGHAATPQGAVAFAGRITIVPDEAASGGTASMCFSALDCAVGDGSAAGAVLAKPIVGMQGTLDYVESCTAAVPYAPVGSGHLTAFFRDAFGQWTDPVGATWIRAGLVAVVLPSGEGTVAGAALAVPAPKVGTVPLCGAPIELAVVGAIAFA